MTWSMWSDQNPVTRVIFVELRLPRAHARHPRSARRWEWRGAAMQSYLRNPLADPGTLGVSAMAALGAVLGIFFGIAGANPWMLPLCGVAGGVLAMAALLLLAGRVAQACSRWCCRGIILSALAVAGISLVLSLSPSPWASSEIIRWMLGALTDRSFDDLTIATPLIAVGGVLDPDVSRGARTRSRSVKREPTRSASTCNRVRWMLCIGMGLLVGASVAVTGNHRVRRARRAASAAAAGRRKAGGAASCRARSAAPRSCWRATFSFDFCPAAPSCSWVW